MCDQHELRDLSAVLGDGWESRVLPIRCLPPLGVHERCEHDPNWREPAFVEMAPWAGVR